MHLDIATRVISDLDGSAGRYLTQRSTDMYSDADGDDKDGAQADDDADDDGGTCENVGPLLLLLLSPSGHSCTFAKIINFQFGSC